MIARDLVGYGGNPPNPDWPGGALIAVNFNLNVEGGGEATLINGDEVSEGMLNDIGVPAQRGVRVAAGRIRVRIRQPARRLARARRVRRILDQGQRSRRRPRAGAKSRLGARPASSAATKSSATAIAGSITARSPRRSSASTSGVPSKF